MDLFSFSTRLQDSSYNFNENRHGKHDMRMIHYKVFRFLHVVSLFSSMSAGQAQ